MTENVYSTRYYIAYWDCNGFECIADLTKWERSRLLSILRGSENEKPPINLYHLVMRARFNPQRFPEIWSFTTTEDVSLDDLNHIANENPQSLVDMIRERGKKLYGDTKKSSDWVIK